MMPTTVPITGGLLIHFKQVEESYCCLKFESSPSLWLATSWHAQCL